MCGRFAWLATQQHAGYSGDCAEQMHALQVTAILYANPHWQPEDGGQLRIWVPPSASSLPVSRTANDDTLDHLDQPVPCPSNQSASSAATSAERSCSLAGSEATSGPVIAQQSLAHEKRAGASQSSHGAAQQSTGSNSEQQDGHYTQTNNGSLAEHLIGLHIQDSGSVEQVHCQASQSNNGQHLWYAITLLAMPCTFSVQLEHMFLHLVVTYLSWCAPHSCSHCSHYALRTIP